MAHKLDTPKLPLVDSSLPSSLALTRHENQCIQMCRDLTGHLTRDGHGITHVVLGPEAFLARFQVAAEIKVTARPFGPGDAIDQANARANEDDFLAQQWATAYLKSEIYRVWPEDWKRLRTNADDILDHCPLHEHFAALRLLFVVSAADIDALKAAVSAPFIRGGNVAAHLREQTNNIARLAAMNHALNNRDAVAMIKLSFCSSRIDTEDMAPCFDKFVMDNPLEADRTPARLTAAVQTFVQNVMPHFTEKRLLSARAHAATIEVSEASKEDGEDYAKEFAAFIAFQNKAKAKLPAPAKAKKRLYCWTHGTIGHASGGDFKACLKPGPGHKFEATIDNQMGGKAPK
jgi:hypothetical protein